MKLNFLNFKNDIFSMGLFMEWPGGLFVFPHPLLGCWEEDSVQKFYALLVDIYRQ